MTPKEEIQLKAQIDKLHKNNGGDYESLLRQVKNRKKKIQLNVPQMLAAKSLASYLLLEWGRGTGKTTMYGYRFQQVITSMPRSTGLFIGPTYQFILTRIVPSLVQGLEMFGMYEGLHYFIGQMAPRGWRSSWGKAYQPPKNYNRYITFYNGTGAHLISQDVAGDGRGLNSDWIKGDESTLLSAAKLQENTDPTLRGTNKKAFEKSPYFGSRFYSGSTALTPEGQWFTDFEEKAEQQPDKINFISATCQWNMENLRKEYLDEAELNAYAHWVYEAEYLNKRPKFTKNGFYGLFDVDTHCYTNFNYSHYETHGNKIDCRGDGDLTKGVTLILGVDWGAAINCASVNQHLRSINEYRTLKSFYVLGSDQKMQDDLFRDIAKYYQYHDCKEIILFYDLGGNHQTGNTRYTRAQQAQKLLQSLGWKVRLLSNGMNNPQHEVKHAIWEAIFKGDHPNLPAYKMNKSNCPELYISMKHAKTKIGSGGEIKKDKSSEKAKAKVLRQHATDLSDANDAPIYSLFKNAYKRRINSNLGLRTSSR